MKAKRLLAALVAGALAACRGHLPLGMEEELAAALRARHIAPERVTVPFALTPEMKAWLAKEVPTAGSEELRLELLVRALLTAKGVALEYESGYTGTAIEVFARKKANCLAFTHLFVGMARELGIAAYYLRVGDLESFEKEGDLVVASGHVTAGYGPATELKILEFAALPVGEYRELIRISDLTAVALFHSNRGAEMLRAGNAREALRWLEVATEIDPDLTDAWVNRGVALRRTGRLDDAEVSYRRALEADPTSVPALQNLAALAELRGRTDEATALRALVARNKNRNPYSYLGLGDVSLAQGRIVEAERFYRRAARLDSGLAEVHAALAEVALAQGKVATAKREARRAIKLDPGEARTRALALRLGLVTPSAPRR